MIGALHRGQHARLGEPALDGRVENGGKVTPLREAAPEAATPDLGQRERREQGVEQAGVADARHELSASGGRGLHRQREDLGVGGFRVPAAKTFEAGLGALGRPFRLRAEDGAEIGVFRDRAGLVGGQIGPADGDRVLRPEAKLLAGRWAHGLKQPAADLLARHFEKDRSGMQDSRLDAFEARGQEMLERPLAGAAGDG